MPYKKNPQFILLLPCAILIGAGPLAHAQTTTPYSDNILGATGLNTVPSARMNESGTVSAGVSTLDPFLHSYIGLQIARAVQITLRQSAQTSSLRGGSKALYPGADAKLLLLEERAHIPAIAIGATAALGHKQMRTPYITMSKRYNNLDFTVGKGWGRFERSGGIFGGVEYFTPIKGLSAKLDYNPDPYRKEKQNGQFSPAPRWSLGLSYEHKSGANFQLGLQGAQKIMARISFSAQPATWSLRPDPPPATPFYAQRATKPFPGHVAKAAKMQGITVQSAQIGDTQASTTIDIAPSYSTAWQIGRTARIIAGHSGKNVESITVTPEHDGLGGMPVTLQRRDLEKAFNQNAASPEEIWNNAQFHPQDQQLQKHSFPQSPFLSAFSLHLQQDLDFSARHQGLLHRTSIIFGKDQNLAFKGLSYNMSMRAGLLQNLDRYDALQNGNIPVRSDINLFAQRRIALNTALISYAHSITPDWHMMINAGYLEEMYAGLGAQLLYRPFGKRYAIGAQLWHVKKRTPYTLANLGLYGGYQNSAQLDLWYDLPLDDLTLHAQGGRYLAGDNAMRIALEKIFDNGTTLSATLAVSHDKTRDILGGSINTTQSINLSIPIGNVKGVRYVPRDTRIDIRAASLTTDIAQTIDAPKSLYNMTTPLAYDQIAKHWQEVTK